MGKKGRCVNIDCDNYKKEIEIETGAEMECPLCHQPLKPIEGKEGNHTSKGANKKVIVGVLAALVIGGACGYFAMSSDDVEKVDAKAVKKTTPAMVAEPVAEPETIADSIAISTPMDEPAETPIPVAEPVETPQKEEAKSPSVKRIQNGRGTVDLGYGTYTGDLKNGKPHGYGVLTYRKSQKIVPSKDFVANAGDTFEGDFRDGKISGMGYWKHNGNMTVVKP